MVLHPRRVLTLLAPAAVAAALLMPAVSLAQAPPTPQIPVAPQTEKLDARACGPGGTQATIGQGGDIVVRKPDSMPLSDKLAQTNGVICPPANIDPEIRAPAQEGGAMKVIPPPVSPGGNPAVQPK